MACNYFNVIIFNVENFTNKNVRVKRRCLINLINFYLYYLIHSKQGWFSSCLFHFFIIMLLIFIYTVFNFFLSSDWSSCALLWDDELLVTLVVASLLASLLSVIVFFFFPMVLSQKLQCMEFLWWQEEHHLRSSAFFSLRMLLMFSLKVRLPRSTSPCVVGVRGAPWTCDMEFYLQNCRILFPVNSFPLSLCMVFGNPNMKNTFCSACTTYSHVLDISGMSQEYLLQWSLMWSTQSWLGEHDQGRFLKSVKSISTCMRKPSAAIGLTTGFFTYLVMLRWDWCKMQRDTNNSVASWLIPE